MFLFPGFQHHFLRAPNWPGRTTLLQDPSAHVYSVLFLLSLYFPSPDSSCLYLSCLYLSLVFISPLFISPLFLYLPCFYISPEPWASHSFYTLSSTHRRPRPLASHEASANQGSRGKSPPNWIHLYPGTPAQTCLNCHVKAAFIIMAHSTLLRCSSQPRS